MNIKQYTVSPHPPFPNNSRLPLILYKDVFSDGSADAEDFESLFLSHHWGGMWRNGVYSFHHFHSTAHEVLGCYGGEAHVQFGGPEGEIVRLTRNDAVLIPAGVSHCLISAKGRFHVVGAYPRGTMPDLCEGNPDLYELLSGRIRNLPDAEADPVSGDSVS